ncbi:hypothetical protein FOA52_002416 [Chlamydomonas sp. UWO 241]|nr:hypothetical protein FOA52_002416 [Chlamydomonas sp. UWO 241]
MHADGSSMASATPMEADPGSMFPLPEGSLEAIMAIGAATDAVERASIAAAKADAFFTAAWTMAAFEGVHAWGVPWWAAVAAVNITTRVCAAPLVVLSQQATAKMMVFNHDMLHAKRLQEAMTKAKTQEEQQRLYHALKTEYATQTAKHGNPMKMALIIPGVMIANATVFISVFTGTSKLMESKAPSLTEGGAFWFTNLTVPDPYYGLPIMCCLVTLAMVEYGITMTGDQGPMAKQAAAFKWIMRGLAFVFIPMGSYVTAGTAVLWVSNSCFAVLQGGLLRHDGFRRGVGLPTMAAMREMGAKVAEATKPADPQAAAAAAGGGGLTGLTIPIDPATGKPVLLKEDPLKKLRAAAAPPPGTRPRR